MKLSVVTIFDDKNAHWLKEGFLDMIPLDCELILCHTKPEIINGIKVNIPQSPKIINEFHEGRTKFCEWKYSIFSFAEARNYAKLHATGDWIISLDTDEYVSPLAWKNIFQIINEVPERIGYVNLNVIAIDPPCESRNETEYHLNYVRASRLFRNDTRIKWSGHCHEMINMAADKLNIAHTDSSVIIEHLGYSSLDDPEMLKRAYRNLYLLAREVAENEHPYYVERLVRTAGLIQDCKEAINLCQQKQGLRPAAAT